MRIEGFLFSPSPILPETRKQDQKTRFPSVDADRTVEFIRYVICQPAHVYRCVRAFVRCKWCETQTLG